MSTPERTVETLGAAVTDELAAEYTLVYTYQGQTLSADVVAALVRGENEWETPGGEDLQQWAEEQARTAAYDAVDELAKQIVRRWEKEDGTDDDADYGDLLDNEWPSSEERLTAYETVYDRGNSTWFDDLVQAHGLVLLRVLIASMDEDAGLSFTPMSVAHFLQRLGFDDTDHNRNVAAEIIDNASPEFGVAMGFALLGVDLADIVGLPTEGKVELRNPYVWLGNPFAGSGWCGEEAFTGTLTVHREDLRTDKDAVGWSWDAVVGGTSARYYAGEIAPAPTTPDDTTSTGTEAVPDTQA